MNVLKETKIIKVKPDLSGEKDIENLMFAGEILRKGGIVAFPTETVYGLGANALDEKAVNSIFKAKGREQDNPLIVHLSKAEDMEKYAFVGENERARLLMLHMPAPLTVIMPKKEIIPMNVTAGLDSVALRVPQSLVARRLIEYAAVPVAAPSANISGKPSPTTAEHVVQDMMGKADVIIDGGSCSVGLESTVVSLCYDVPKLLRPGGFTYEELCEILGRVEISEAVLSQLKAGQKAESPGMKYKHYAPNAKVILVKGERKNASRLLEEKYREKNVGIICYEDDVAERGERVIFVGKRGDNRAYAEKMFDALRETDKIAGVDTVYACIPEDTSGISFAIYNRMLRAAAFCVIDADKTENGEEKC